MEQTRSSILERFRAKVAEGRPVIAAGAGSGISAKYEEAGGVDLIVAYNSGRFRMAGHGSLAGMLAYGNANQTVREMAPEILGAVRRTPVLAGVCATDPFLLPGPFLRELSALGFAGIQNFPTVGLIDGRFRQNLEATGMSFTLEVECIARAHAMGLVTAPFVFDAEQARGMAKAGADLVIAHLGLIGGGTPGAASAGPSDECVRDVRRIADAALSARPDVLVLCHDGPIATPGEAQLLLDRCPELSGLYGTSALERLPTETAIAEHVRRFSSLALPKPRSAAPLGS